MKDSRSMKLIDKKNKIKVEKEDLDDAKLSSINFAGIGSRKRAYANILAARLAMKFLFSHKIEATNLYSLYTIHSILEKFDIADIYFKNIKLDVRLVFSPNEIFIPKTHFEYGLEPDIYLVLLARENMSSVEFLGFFDAEEVSKGNANNDYYFYEYDLLQAPDRLKSFLENYIPKNHFNTPESVSEELEELLLAFVDGETSEKDSRYVIKQLAMNFSLREKFVEFENFELLSKEVGKNQSMLQDSFLDIVGAQKVFEEENTSQTLQNSKAEILAEVLDDDILNEDSQDSPNNTPAKDATNFAAGLIAGAGLSAAAAGAAGAAVTGAGLAAAGMAASGLTPLPDIDLGEFNFGEGETHISHEPELVKMEDDLFETPGQQDDSEVNDFDFAKENEFDDESKEFEEIDQQETFETEEIEQEQEITESLPSIDDEDDFLDFEEEIPAYLNQETVVEDLPHKDEETQEEIFQEDEKEIENFDETLPLLDFSEIEELEQLPEIENLEIDEQAPEELALQEETDSGEGVVDIEDFNFNEFENDKTPEENHIEENDDSAPIEDKENDPFEEFSKLESQEYPEEQEGNNLEADNLPEQDDLHDDLIFQVEEFLNSVDLSDEQKSTLESTLTTDFDIPEEISSSIEKESEAVFLPDDENDDIIDKLNQSSGQIDPENEGDLLQVLFEKEQINEETQIENPKENVLSNLSKNKKMVIAASVASVVLVTFVAGGAIISHNNSANMQASQIQAQNQPMQPGQPVQPGAQDPTQPGMAPNPTGAGMNPSALNQPSDQGQMPSIDQAMAQGPQEIPGEGQSASRGDMGKAVSDAFLSEPVNASISKVAWEVPEDLAYNDSVRKYLQMAGRNLKLNLQNSLLLSTEMAYSNKVIVDLNIGSNGSLQSSNISASSGSKQIDKIVLQSVKDTLTYLKMPSSELGGRSNVLTLIINF